MNFNIIDKEINSGDTITLKTIENRYISIYSLKPVIYYVPNETTPITKLETNKGVDIDTYESIINQIKDMVTNQKVKTIKLLTYRNNEQSEELINNRVSDLKDKLSSKNFKLNFEVVNKVIDKSKFKNNELIEENNKI